MSDLAQSLIDAAAAEFPVDPCNPDNTETVAGWELVSTTEEGRREEPNLPEMYSVPEWGPVGPLAAAVVAAVLETLAADYEGDGTVYVSVGDLRALAAEVREGTP